jgi:small ligand-binding sensory domain FIST
MDSWSADLILGVLPFLSLRELNRLSQTSPRYYYLVHKYREIRGPEFVVASSHTRHVRSRQKTAQQVIQDALSKLQTAPNLALAFSNRSITFLNRHLPRLLPNDTTITLHASADSIQSCVDGHLESQSHVSLMLARLPCARVHAFCLEGELELSRPNGKFSSFLADLRSSNEEWKVFLVYICQTGYNQADEFVRRLQARFPTATIVGGVCSYGSVTLPVTSLFRESRGLASLEDYIRELSGGGLTQLLEELGVKDVPSGRPRSQLAELVIETLRTRPNCLHHVEDGIFGIALGGDVPVRSIVSRGVKSLTLNEDRPGPRFVVQDDEVHRPGDEGYMFRFHPDVAPPYRIIRSFLDVHSGRTLRYMEMCATYGDPDYCGIMREGDDGYELLVQHEISNSIDALVFLGEDLGGTWAGSEFDFFNLDGAECKNDLEEKMRQLREASAGEQVLGAVMFSCNGRGPEAGVWMSEPMADAKRFTNVFPAIPLAGFYAMGEIGPRALAARRSVFQEGNASLQGFTAVFAVFVVPNADLGAVNLDDRAEQVRAFVGSRLMHT